MELLPSAFTNVTLDLSGSWIVTNSNKTVNATGMPQGGDVRIASLGRAQFLRFSSQGQCQDVFTLISGLLE